MKKIKEPVRLRQRTMASGRVSLYLDIYEKGKRSYEYLNLYLMPERTKEDRERNKETLSFAETIRAKRVVELRNDQYGFKQKDKNGAILFIEYFNEMAELRKGRGTYAYWKSCLAHLHQYAKKDVFLSDIKPEWLTGFRQYLDRLPLARNTKGVYFGTVRGCIAKAVRDGLIKDNPMIGVENFRKEDVERSFLTLEELRCLIATPVKKNTVRRAFLFSCLTGLRWSDVKNLKWADVKEQGGFTRIVFAQKKTKGLEYLDLNVQAVELMGKRGEGVVFKGLTGSDVANNTIKKWVKAAGINKYITFHCARHTFAVMMLDIGVDIYTVSKLLGHRELSTTQIYAKVLDKNKRKAVEMIPNIL